MDCIESEFHLPTDAVEVGAAVNPLAAQDRFRGGGRRDDYLLPAGREFRTFDGDHFHVAANTHLLDESAPVLFGTAVDVHPLHGPDGADSFDLGLCLFTGAENSNRGGIRPGAAFRRNAT